MTVTTYGDLCGAVIAQLRNTPVFDRQFDALDTIDVDYVAVAIGSPTIMDLARFISGVAGRMGWATDEPFTACAVCGSEDMRRQVVRPFSVCSDHEYQP